MTISTYPEAATPADVGAQVRALQDEAWPSDGSGLDAGHDPALSPQTVVLTGAGRVLAACDVLFTAVTNAGQDFRVAGLSAVVTRSDERRRGLGRQVVTAARPVMIEHGADLALFTCDRGLEPFYRSTGWQLLAGTVLVGGTPADPLPSDAPGFDKLTFGDFFTDPAIRFRASFVGARVELYPGPIDRLF